MQHSPYYNPQALMRETAAGRHREAIGGLWEELGGLQLEFLKSQGMQPSHRLLDIGCGALRLGVKAVDYLDSGHYYGADISEELMEAGYQLELDDALREKLPRHHLHQTGDFDFSFLPQPVDFAMAQSVFTHLPLNHIRRCLAALATQLVSGGVFFATAWLLPEAQPINAPFTQSGELEGQPIITTDIADPYHYHPQDFAFVIQHLPLTLEIIGDWHHPRGQPMLAFRKA